jgi:transposase-like protein
VKQGESLPISNIRLDGGTQPRATIDVEAVVDYMDAMAGGAIFPPVVVFYDGTNYWLADGFHRVKAAEQSGMEHIACDLRQGTQQDAQWYSFGANKATGLRRTNEDKQRAVKAALLHSNGVQLSNRRIAAHVGVDEGTVRGWRERLTAEIPQSSTRTRTERREEDATRHPHQAEPRLRGRRSDLAVARNARLRLRHIFRSLQYGGHAIEAAGQQGHRGEVNSQQESTQ